jgi:cysteinyl-tRNA synthetase
MSKSLGNIYTVRDLVLMGHKPSAIRFLLSQVPYRKQLNFTFVSLQQSASEVERLRNFKLRLETEPFSPGANPDMAELAQSTRTKMTEALADDLNTAQARAAIFDMVREVNTAADMGEVKKDDVLRLLGALQQFDEIFDVIRDNDLPKMQRTLQWARAEGKLDEAAVPVLVGASLSDSEVEAKIAERQQAKRARNFAKADAIRAELAEAGIIVEDTKDGVRWKRK